MRHHVRMTTGAGFNPLGFTPAFDVELDPEYPGDGDWGIPTIGIDPGGGLCEPFESRWGPPLVVRVDTPDGSWAASFAAGGLGSATGTYACPSPTHLLVVSGSSAYLVDVPHAQRGATVLHSQVTDVVRAGDRLLVVGIVDIVGVGPQGVDWRTARLCLDGLRVIDTAGDCIRCTGEFFGDVHDLAVDATTGQRTEGPAFAE